MTYVRYAGRTIKKGECSGPRCSAEYAAWANMWTRCRNPKYSQWKDYGGRGIKVCARWRTYAPFLEDMGRMPRAGYTLDREDNDAAYCPQNCRWLSRQKNTKHRATLHKAFGVKKTLRQWLADPRVAADSMNMLYLRMRREGWSFRRALTQPKEIHKRRSACA